MAQVEKLIEYLDMTDIVNHLTASNTEVDYHYQFAGKRERRKEQINKSCFRFLLGKYQIDART